MASDKVRIAELNTLLDSSERVQQQWRPIVGAAVSWHGASVEDREDRARTLHKVIEEYLRQLLAGTQGQEGKK